MLLTKDLVFGDLRGTLYTFERAGDELEKHVHGEEDIHITIVTKGSVKVYSHDWEIIAEAGKILDFRPHEPHGFVALEDGTKIVGMLKNVSSFSKAS